MRSGPGARSAEGNACSHCQAVGGGGGVPPRRARRDVALKVVKSASHYRETALDEVKLCQRVAVADPTHPGHMHVAELLDSFEHAGPHGVRTCTATPVRAA